MRHGGRIPQLDGLRGVAILLVLTFHIHSGLVAPEFPGWLKTWMRFGWCGVDLFFVLSGFLIGGILLDTKERDDYFSKFYTRRFWRIVPLYLSLCAFFWCATSLFHVKANEPLPWISYATFTQNLWSVAASHDDKTILGSTWSLAVEEQFYLLLPLLLCRMSNRSIPKLILTSVVAAIVTRVVLYSFLSNGRLATYVLTPCRMDGLMIGVGAAYFVRGKYSIDRSKLFLLLAILGTGVTIFIVNGWTQRTVMMTVFGYTWFALFFAALLLYVVNFENSRATRMLSHPWLCFTGTIAYGLYLVHPIFLGEAKRLFSDPLTAAGVAMVGSFIFATCSWKFFEKPLINYGTSLTRQT